MDADPALARSLRAARAAFYRRSGFSEVGDADQAWQEVAFGAVRYRVPNLRARTEVLERHDLHHVLTGYAADWRGESEISAWELASGAAPQPYAWLIALWGLFVGIVALPVATFRAFVRGRGSRNLYAERDVTPWLEVAVAEAREARRVAPLRPTAWPADTSPCERSADVAAFAAWSAPAVLLGLVAALPALGLVALAHGRALLAGPCPLCCASALA